MAAIWCSCIYSGDMPLAPVCWQKQTRTTRPAAGLPVLPRYWPRYERLNPPADMGIKEHVRLTCRRLSQHSGSMCSCGGSMRPCRTASTARCGTCGTCHGRSACLADCMINEMQWQHPAVTAAVGGCGSGHACCLISWLRVKATTCLQGQ